MSEKNIIIEKVKNAVAELDKNSEVILFGSRARGDFKEDSDWDFAAFANLDVNEKLRSKLTYKIFEIELETGSAISVFLYSFNQKEEFAPTLFFQNIKEEGIIV